MLTHSPFSSISRHPYILTDLRKARPYHKNPSSARQDLSTSIVDSAGGFPYSRKLRGHRSCVNALAFSSGEGRFLASGGDDLRICIWDLYQDDVKSPSFFLRGAKANIFSLDFSATNKYLISGGSSEQILKYDVTYLGSSIAPTEQNYSPDEIYRHHDDSIRTVACHPVQDELFMSASEDGTIRRYDARTSPGRMASQDVIVTESEVTGVQYHPVMEHLFVTSDSTGRVLLRDARMAFGPLNKRSQEGIIQKYNTKLTKKQVGHLSNPEASSVVFDRDGSKFAVTFQHYLPTIYALLDPDPLAVLDCQKSPDGNAIPTGQRTYRNSCTMKHGSFGGPSTTLDTLYAAGSDDFRTYIWQIPTTLQLQSQRQILTDSSWEKFGSLSTIAFAETKNSSKVIPVEIDKPLCRLTGHESIVNTTRFHPHFLQVVTAGVERDIVLHSATSSSPCTQDLELSSTDVRQLDDDEDDEDRHIFLWALTGVQPLTIDSEDDASERQTLRLFDHLLREEGNVDIFDTRKWRSSMDHSDDENVDSDSDGDNSSIDYFFVT